MLASPPAARHLKNTLSACPACLTKVPAVVFELEGQIRLRKSCPDHGVQEVLIADDPAFYWADGAPGGDCATGCVLGHSCTLLFEITDRCNLTCPTCFAGSSPQETRQMTLATFEAQLDRLLAEGRRDADIVQLSGGEPTLHPELEAMIAACFARGLSRVYVNTNGVRLAREPAFAERLARLDEGDRLQLYLQLDGQRDETSTLLRGRRGLAEVKARAIENALANGLYVMPVMTVTRGINLDEVGAVIRTALAHHPRMNTVILQPAFHSGRYEHERASKRLTVGELAREVEAQTNGLFAAEDFGPLPCSSPNCFAMAVGLVRDGAIVPVSRYFPKFETWTEPDVAKRVARFADHLPQNLLDVLAEDAVVDELLDLLAADDDAIDWQSYKSFFLVGIKPFMDVSNYDQDRVDRCCVHVVDREGRPVSFCEYNALRRPRGLP